MKGASLRRAELEQPRADAALVAGRELLERRADLVALVLRLLPDHARAALEDLDLFAARNLDQHPNLPVHLNPLHLNLAPPPPANESLVKRIFLLLRRDSGIRALLPTTRRI